MEDRTNTAIISPEEARRLTEFIYDEEAREKRNRNFYALTGAAYGEEANSAWNAIGGNVQTLGRSSSRENFIRMVMMADGYSYDFLYAADARMDAVFQYYGRKTMELLSNTGEDRDKKIEEVFRKAGQELYNTTLPSLEIDDVQNVNRAILLGSFIKDYQQTMEGDLMDSYTDDKKNEHGLFYRELLDVCAMTEKYCEVVQFVGLSREARIARDDEIAEK